MAEHLLSTVREGLTNIGRHAGASRASVTVVVEEGRCTLEITDNGRGLGGESTHGGGLGLPNMRQRAEKLHGTFEIGSPEEGGTLLVWRVPVGS